MRISEQTSRRLIDLALVLVVGGVAFAGGRYSKPDKVVTIHEKGETKIEYKERIVYKDRKVRTETTKTHTKNPDGTETTTTSTKTDSDTKTSDSTESKTKTETTEKTKTTVENKKPDWRVAGMVGVSPGKLSLDLKGMQPLYGVQVDRRVIGTVWAGAWVLTRPQDISGTTMGLHVAVEF